MKVAPPEPGGALFSGAAERAYLVLGCLIGAAGGPLQAASRTLLIRLAPKDRIAQYFGLFALTGKVTSFIGPLLIGAITAVTASQKAGMAVLVVFFVAGLALLTRVRKFVAVVPRSVRSTALRERLLASRELQQMAFRRPAEPGIHFTTELAARIRTSDVQLHIIVRASHAGMTACALAV